MTSLPQEQLLIVLAEISVAVAGFSGIMAVVGRPTEEVDKAKLRGLVEAALGNIVLSLLPLVIIIISASAASTWRICATAFAAWIVGWHIARLDHVNLIPKSLSLGFVALGDLVMLVALVCVSLALGDLDGGLVYTASLLWILTQTFIFFAQALAGLWRSGP